ncbi:LysM peptidoglycan-binding domain-containing protein [Cohnella thailandensis]|uniref:LysM peptidoglycan-binding domain-containing protein n=1 Tax=Cohnella thailandensis TaxID=557557 RepID=A0A841SM61_9BACL|nr:LysM peptidoglycan-binding domain-containing protein [Cohnella thailandensis]MBB6633563.1 LysM peptidoglycan-binding domain-containing protein [Cohnella thailandensis]MBP1974581.1 LysM repeat protein [Cohnella thailandensis]
MPYSMELSYNNRLEFFELPVLPDSIEFKGDGGSSTYTIVGLGEISVIKDRSLREIRFSSFFPMDPSRIYREPDLQNGSDNKSTYFEPEWYVQRIESWLASKIPIRFIFTSDAYQVNTAASIESFEWSEVAGSGGDIEYKLELKEYRFYSAKKVELPSDTTKATKTARPDEKQIPKTYTLVAGDSLFKVAQKVLGDSGRWREIQKLNGITDAQLKTLQIGRILKMPS